MKRLPDISFNICELREAATYLYGTYKEDFSKRIINLNHRPQDVEWKEKIYGPGGNDGRFIDRTGRRTYFEKEFTVFNSQFKNTYFYEVWKQMKEYLGGSTGRIRLMKFPPRSCLSLHRDYEIRYHIPIITNPRSYLMVSEKSNKFPEVFGTRVPDLHIHHLPADGSVYMFDTTHYHSAFNLGNTDRIHLLIANSNDSPNMKNEDLADAIEY